MRVVQLTAILTISILLFLAHMRLTEAAPVTIRVAPLTLFAGDAFWLTCRIRPDDRNRLIDYGVTDYRDHSQRPIAGASGPNVIQVLVEHVPCDVGPAYCQIGRTDGSWSRAVQPFTVAGCDP